MSDKEDFKTLNVVLVHLVLPQFLKSSFKFKNEEIKFKNVKLMKDMYTLAETRSVISLMDFMIKLIGWFKFTSGDVDDNECLLLNNKDAIEFI